SILTVLAPLQTLRTSPQAILRPLLSTRMTAPAPPSSWEQQAEARSARQFRRHLAVKRARLLELRLYPAGHRTARRLRTAVTARRRSPRYQVRRPLAAAHSRPSPTQAAMYRVFN